MGGGKRSADGVSSRIARSTSLTLFLNSRIPFPIDAPISGTRFAPKRTSTITSTMNSSIGPRLNGIISS
jgi:hypothetical protein